MKRVLLIMSLCTFFCATAGGAQMDFEKDTIETCYGNLEITFIGHGTLMLEYDGKVIHVDPWTGLADYSRLPKADIILITHEHRDHLDLKALELLRTEKSIIILTGKCASQVEGGIVMNNGDAREVEGLPIEAVPLYNIVHMRSEGVAFHPKGDGNGYIMTFCDKKVYIAGDTENTPEMKALKDIDIAFLPMNLPYTMTPEMVADAAKAFRPAILYPYHYGSTDTSELVDRLKDESGIEVRIRRMK